MNGTIAQFVALTCYGNAFLRGASMGVFFPSNSTFQFCDRVTFVELSSSLFGNPKEKTVAETPDQWFAHLKQTGCSGLWLALTPQNDPNIPDRMSAGFVGGGGTWKLESMHPKGDSGFWLSRWEVWNQNAPERRIWRVTYGRVNLSKWQQHPPADPSIVAQELHGALTDIHAFSLRNNCGGFTDCFARALKALDGDSSADGYHKDLSPDGALSSDALRVLHACQHAWVFGGMGSWNDMGFDGEEGKTYDRISERLFRSINAAVPVAANSSFRDL